MPVITGKLRLPWLVVIEFVIVTVFAEPVQVPTASVLLTVYPVGEEDAFVSYPALLEFE